MINMRLSVHCSLLESFHCMTAVSLPPTVTSLASSNRQMLVMLELRVEMLPLY